MDNFYYECKNLNLDIIGLMSSSTKWEPWKNFSKLKECSDKFGLKDLSMGMSNDYDVACKFGSTFWELEQRSLVKEVSLSLYNFFV